MSKSLPSHLPSLTLSRSFLLILRERPPSLTNSVCHCCTSWHCCACRCSCGLFAPSLNLPSTSSPIPPPSPHPPPRHITPPPYLLRSPFIMCGTLTLSGNAEECLMLQHGLRSYAGPLFAPIREVVQTSSAMEKAHQMEGEEGSMDDE